MDHAAPTSPVVPHPVRLHTWKLLRKPRCRFTHKFLNSGTGGIVTMVQDQLCAQRQDSFNLKCFSKYLGIKPKPLFKEGVADT